MHVPFIVRQLSRSSKQATVFVLCVMLSICSISAFSGFADSVNRSLMNDARAFHAADIIIRSNSKISEKLNHAISDLVSDGDVKRARIYEFNSIVRTMDDDHSLLADIKIVEKGYPFYGSITLDSGNAFQGMLSTGRAIVAQSLLDRLGIRVGDGLKVGYATLRIVDVVITEPDRPVDVFSLGPRIFISYEDRDALGLIDKGSRVRFIQLLKTARTADTNTVAENLKKIALTGQERVDTFQTAQSRFKRFVDNFLFFMKLVGFFIMVISGFGMQVTLGALLNEKKNTIAIMKTVGATNRYVTRHFMHMVAILGISGIILGLLAGYLVQQGLARTMVSFLPENIQVAVSWTGIFEGILLGIAVVSMFTFLPLYHIKNTRPVMILRKDLPDTFRMWPYILSVILFLIFFSSLVFWHMKDLKFGLYFVGGICGLILVAFLLTEGLLIGLKKTKIRQLALRQSIKGLFRRGNATKPVVITLTASLCVIFSIYLIEKNLDASFIQSYPSDAPNVFFLDIQLSQLEEFKQFIGPNVIVYPVVRARIISINGQKIDREKERQQRRDNFSRVFNLTYRNSLMASEKLLKGRGLFRPDWDEPQVSILDMVTDMRDMNVGDSIVFNIQGVPLEARISSIRGQEMETMSPFFYFVFPESVLKTAPQTLFAALHMDQNRIPSLQNAVVSRFPNISVIDVTETIKTFSRLLRQLSAIVRFFTFLSMAAGILILISAVFATRADRVVESVYYKVLGAKKTFVFSVFALENLMIGMVSGLLALIIAHTATAVLCEYTFEISYHAFIISSVYMVAAATMLIVAIGVGTSQSILNKKPISILKEQPDG